MLLSANALETIRAKLLNANLPNETEATAAYKREAANFFMVNIRDVIPPYGKTRMLIPLIFVHIETRKPVLVDIILLELQGNTWEIVDPPEKGGEQPKH